MTTSVSVAPDDYQMVAASASAFTLGSSGATGDYISHLVIIPETTSPGVVTLVDGSSANIIFTGGASSVSSLVPFMIVIGAKSRNGPWKITNGTNVHVVAVGRFS